MSKEERALDLPGKPPRFAELDSLRGLAALAVVLSHFTGVYLNTRHYTVFLYKFPMRILLDGRAAVILFFLLSGFVLSLPYRQRGLEYGTFLVRRICRIYLPYLGALLLAVLGDWWHHGPVQGTGMGCRTAQPNLVKSPRYSADFKARSFSWGIQLITVQHRVLVTGL
jgi:peptidoglycan/LPS O-acetylase OafA/YrhL